MRYFIPLALVLVLCGNISAAAEGETFRVSTSYRNLLSNAGCSGMLDQIIKEAFRRINVKCEIVFTNTRRSLVLVNDGQLDAEINRIEGMEKSYPNLIRVPEPNMQMEFVAFAKQKFPVSGWESLRDLRVGMVQGWKMLERNTEGFQHLTRLTEIATLFEMLELDRLDVVLYSKLTGYEQLQKMEYHDIHALSPPLAVRSMYMYLNKKHKDLASPLAEALREMKEDGAYARIMSETTGHLH